MNSKDINNNITDQAWNRLYNRIEKDGLLTESNMHKRVLLPSPLKWVAGIAILSICLATAWVLRDEQVENSDMLTLNNGINAPTLVSTLEDGSIVYLSEYTSLQYPSHFSKDKRQVFLEGNAFFDISKNPERPFIIDTKEFSIEVLGTTFNVNSEQNASFRLSVQRGKVKITSKSDGKAVYVEMGETALIQSGKLNTIPTSNVDQFSKYLEEIRFKDQKLCDVVKVLNSRSNSTLLKVDREIEDRLITGTFSDDAPETMAELICEALNLQYTQQENTIVISEHK